MTFRLAMFGCAAAMALAACGGGSPDGFIEAAGQAAAQAGGAELDDFQLGDDGFSATVDGADITFGGGGSSERPDWLEPEFIWPDGFEVSYAINDEVGGERAYVGLVRDADLATLQAEQHRRLIAAGYELLGDSGIYVHPERATVEVDFDQGPDFVQVSVSGRNEDEEVLRDVYAPVEGDGTMAVSLGDESYVFEGPCSLVSDGGQFNTADALDGTTSKDGSITLNVREGEQDYILANVTIADETSFAVWTVLQRDEAGNAPTVGVDASGFSVDGFMTDMATGDVAPVAIRISCPG